jgi:hypothetical protein
MGLGTTVTASQVSTDAQAAALTASLANMNPGGNGYSAIPGPTMTPGVINSGGFSVLVGAGAGYGYDVINDGVPPTQAQLSQVGVTGTHLNYAQTIALLNLMQSVSSSAAATCSFALFGEASCITIGSKTIGTTTALVLGGVALALLLLMGGKK